MSTASAADSSIDSNSAVGVSGIRSYVYVQTIVAVAAAVAVADDPQIVPLVELPVSKNEQFFNRFITRVYLFVFNFYDAENRTLPGPIYKVYFCAGMSALADNLTYPLN